MLRTGAERRRGERGGPVFWTFGVVLVLAAFWISGGHALFGRSPIPVGGEPESALKIASLESRVERRGDKAVLFVDGEAVNGGDKTEQLPKLSINVLGKEGTTTHYFLGTNNRPLGPGESFAFSSRLQAPKDGVQSVSVTIGEREE